MCIRDSSRRRGCCTRRSGSSPAAVRRGWERVEGPETRKPLNRAAALGGEPRAPRRGKRDDAWDRVEAFPLDTSRVPKGFHPNHLILGSDPISRIRNRVRPVSYTHLTLPTSDLV